MMMSEVGATGDRFKTKPIGQQNNAVRVKGKEAIAVVLYTLHGLEPVRMMEKIL